MSDAYARFVIRIGLTIAIGLLGFARICTADPWQECAKIIDDKERLQCYDSCARTAALRGEEPVDQGKEEATADDDEASYLTKKWDLARTQKRFVFIPHNDNYLMPITYNKNHYQPERNETYPVDDVKATEVEYQISFKTRAWKDILGSKADFWLAYTQRSFWQLYEFEDSSPFRETDYEPEAMINYPTELNLWGLHLRTITAGFNHQSNGRSEPTSRSWNRIIGNLGFETGDFTLQVKGWYRIPEAKEDDDNRDIDDYFGPGELRADYVKDRHRLGGMLRNNFQSENRTTLEIDYSYRFNETIGLYVQYFNGYGENLLDYNQYANRIGAGIILTDW